MNIFKYKTTLCETTVFVPFHSKIAFKETIQKRMNENINLTYLEEETEHFLFRY